MHIWMPNGINGPDVFQSNSQDEFPFVRCIGLEDNFMFDEGLAKLFGRETFLGSKYNFKFGSLFVEKTFDNATCIVTGLILVTM